MDVAANELETAVANERAGEQTGFDQDLKPVAYAEHEAAIAREPAHGLHHGRELGDGAAAQVIAISEAAGQDDGVDVTERSGVVPDEFGRLPEDGGDGVKRVVIAIAARKDDNAKFHGSCCGEVRFYFSKGGWGGGFGGTKPIWIQRRRRSPPRYSGRGTRAAFGRMEAQSAPP